MSGKLQDDASLYWESRHSSVQDYEIPEPEPEEIPSFIEPDTTIDDPVEYISDRDVKTELNMIRLNEPTAEIVVAMIDVILPMAMVLLIKGTEKEEIKLEDGERETLVSAWAQYLKTTSFNMSPGAVLCTTMITIYGAKITMAMMNKGKKESEIDELRKQNQMLKKIIDENAEHEKN
ncbi:hypothetical protein LJC53_05575 [Bacteroidales bacterium OttesenSCG-928-C03]|nr:hypothetical protein [Bacteroidales bacterium OttesenSCG-928-C03]MDL2326738.1 hypothetical protein [Bacteroidales bacterium OttesenSCG-928-A14]